MTPPTLASDVNFFPLIMVLAVAALAATAEIIFDAEWSILGVLIVIYLVGVMLTDYLTSGATLGIDRQRAVFLIPFLFIGLLRLVAAFGYVAIHYMMRPFRGSAT